MSRQELAELIQSKFQKKSDFIRTFNNLVEKEILDKTVLSAQLSGKRILSNGWIAAYKMFFHFLSESYQNSILNNEHFIKNQNSLTMTESVFSNKKYQTVFNHQIHEAAQLDISTFLTRIENVLALRAGWNRNFSFYPTSKQEYDENIKIWNYVNGKRNALNNLHYVYVLSIPKPLYYFLRHSKRSQVFKPIILGLATLYVLQPEKRKIMKDQLYSSFYDKAEKVAKKYFSEILYYNPTDDELHEEGYFLRYWQRYRDMLDEAIKDYVGNTTLIPFIDASSIGTGKRYEMAILERNEYDIGCPYAYMTDSDWQRIVLEENKEDNLTRAESNYEILTLWKESLWNYHKQLETNCI